MHWGLYLAALIGFVRKQNHLSVRFEKLSHTKQHELHEHTAGDQLNIRPQVTEGTHEEPDFLPQSGVCSAEQALVL